MITRSQNLFKAIRERHNLSRIADVISLKLIRVGDDINGHTITFNDHTEVPYFCFGYNVEERKFYLQTVWRPLTTSVGYNKLFETIISFGSGSGNVAESLVEAVEIVAKRVRLFRGEYEYEKMLSLLTPDFARPTPPRDRGPFFIRYDSEKREFVSNRELEDKEDLEAAEAFLASLNSSKL